MILDTYSRNGTTMQMEAEGDTITIVFFFCGIEFEKQFMDDPWEAAAFWDSLKEDEDVFGPTAEVIPFPRRIA